MVYGNFGIKLFFHRDILLTASGRLVSFGKGNRGELTLDSPTNVYFYIKDDEICQEHDDSNYVSNVVELSQIPIYEGNNPKYAPYGDGLKRKKNIEESMTCIYYFHDEYVLKFNLHFLYKGHIYDVPISEKVLSLLKYTWFTSQMLSFDDMGRIGEKNYNYVTNINVYKIVNELKIISGEKTFYGRDSESTSFAERWIINTDDFYILNTLLNFSETHYPPPCNYHNHKLCMYGSRFAIEYKLFKKHHLFLRAKLDVIAKLIEDKKMEFNVKDCIKYILLEKYLLNQRPSHTLSIQCCPLDTEYIEKEKSETIITEFINTYSVGKHLGGLLYIQSEAIKVPSKMMNEITISYNEWRLKEIQNSGLEHLTSYWSAKEICDEFNKRSNKRFNFRFDFSLFDNIPLADNEFSGFDWETYLGAKSDN